MKDNTRYIKTRLAFDARAHDRMRCLRCVLWFCAALVALLGSFAALDYWSYMPLWRMGFIPLAGVGSLIAVVRLWKILVRPSNEKNTALNFETNQSGQGCVISTSVDYLESSDEKCDEARELQQILHEKAARQLVMAETRTFHLLKVPLTLTSIACLALATFMLGVPDADIALSRVLSPWNTTAYTSLKVEPGNVSIPLHSNQEITVSWKGRSPKHAFIDVKYSGKDVWESIRLGDSAEDTFQYELIDVDKDLEYRVRTDDILSPVYSVDAFTPPSLVDIKVHSTPPDYTQKLPFVLDTPDISVLRGSRLDFQFGCSEGITSAHLRFEDQTTLPLKYEQGVWRGNMVLNEDRLYWLDLADREGRKGGNQIPFQLVALPDEKPKIRILDPGKDIRAKSEDVVPIQFEVEDDFGVAEIELRYKKMNGEEQSIRYSMAEGNELQVSDLLNIDLGPLGLGAYEVVYYYMVAVDNNSMDGPGQSETPLYFVEITDKTAPLSDCQSTSQQVNLLHLEKQIIALTMQMKEEDPGSYSKLSNMQDKTLEFSRIYEQSYELALAPEMARFEYAAAQKAMGEAKMHFDQLSKEPALKSAELALAHLYETVRLLPELEAGMCRSKGECFKIVLKAIEEKKYQEKKRLEEEVQRILRQAKQIMRTEEDWLKRLTELIGDTKPPSKVLSAAASSNNQGNVSSKFPQTFNQKNAETKQEGEQFDMEGGSKQLGGLSKEQKEIADKISELAKGLGDLAQRDEKVPPIFAEETRQVAKHFDLSHAEVQVRPGYGVGHARQGIMVLASVIEDLEAIQMGGDSATLVDVQLYPEKYEHLISEYLKGLSFAE